jgi:hypothetical protein
MIFVSSARPMGDDPEYDRNQLAAKASWELVASAIVYFNDVQPQLASAKTRFLPSQPYPFIRDMVDFCADQEAQWCALINSDIIVTPAIKRVMEKLKAKNAYACASWRWNFDPADGIEKCAHEDNGLDFFMAIAGAWELIYQQEAPKFLKFGAPSWDSWMLGAFFKLLASGFYDITAARVIRHPRHGGRKHGTGVPSVHYIAWPVMGPSIL